MKVLAILSPLVLVLALPGSAAAQGSPARRAEPATTTTRTSDYVEQRTGSDQVVQFTGDELAGPAGGVFGTTIRRPPGILRQNLIRPRLNFVPELLASVENL